MNPQDPYSQPQNVEPQKTSSVNNPLSAMRENERNIFEAKRHPIGMLGIYITAGILLVVMAVLAFGVVPATAQNFSSSSVNSLAAVVFAIVALLTVGFVFVSHYVYWGNRWILTDDSLTQVLQRSLFDKQSSQLSLANLEDVTVEQNGILAHMFNFGTLRAETAGERSKFVLTFCPNPNDYARQVLEAREEFEQGTSEKNDNPTAAPTPAPSAPSQTVSFEVPTDDDLSTR